MKIPAAGKDQLMDRYYPVITDLDDSKTFQEYGDEVLGTNNVFISTLAMDFPSVVSAKRRKEIDNLWREKFPGLNHIRKLELRHKVDQDYLEAICKIKSLEALCIWTSNASDIMSLTKLNRLKALTLSNFSRLEDISCLQELKSLEYLSILSSFKIKNYESIGKISNLKSLEIGGDTFAPRNLMLESLEPFVGLEELLVLDMSSASIRDKNYRLLLSLKKLKRLDAHWKMSRDEREFIKSEHPSLKSGFFMAYDFNKNEFKKGIEWWVEAS